MEVYSFLYSFIFIFLMFVDFEREGDRRTERENANKGGTERKSKNLKQQALCCQHKTLHEAPPQEL